MSKVVSVGVAGFLFLFLLAFTLGYSESYTPITYGEPYSRMWPLGAILLALFYLKDRYYNPRSIVLVVLAAMTLLVLSAYTDSEESFKLLMTLIAIGAIGFYAPAGLRLDIAIPAIFVVSGLGFLAYYLEMKRLAAFVLTLTVAATLVVLAKPRNYLDNIAILIGSLLVAN